MSYLTTPTKWSGKRVRKHKSNSKPVKRRKTVGGDEDEEVDNHLRDCFSSESSSEEDSEEKEGDEDQNEEEIDWKKLEQVLEESAQKANLTAVNVKSILHVRFFIYSCVLILAIYANDSTILPCYFETVLKSLVTIFN